MTSVFVTDGRSLAALATVRSLGSRGIRIHTGDEIEPTITSPSRYVSENVEYPDPNSRPTEWVDELVRRTRRYEYDQIIPVRDETTSLLAAHRDEFPKATSILLPPGRKIEEFRDKGKAMKLAADHGVPTPTTYYPGEEELDSIAVRATFPVVVKPRRSSGARGIRKVERAAELRDVYKSVQRKYDDPIVQEYVAHDGGHLSVGTVFDTESEPVGVHVYEELTQYPSSGGPAVTARSVPIEPWVDDIVEMFREEGWQGPAHLDVLYDAETDTPRVIEVNPRLWMSIALTIRSGVDVPEKLYRSVNGLPVEQTRTYDTDVEYRWVLPNQILSLLEHPDKLKVLRDFAPSENQTCYGVLSRTDPLPVVGFVGQSLQYLLDAEKRAQIFERDISEPNVESSSY